MFLDIDTHLYAVVGSRIGSSRSPKVFNTLFERYQWNGLYLYLQKTDPQEIFLLLKTIPLQGVSVTMPHKESAYFWSNQKTSSAQIVGVVNTIVRQKDGTLLGSNEDYESFLELVQKKIPPVKQKKVLICGRGSVARTSAIALLQVGYVKEFIFLVRTLEKKIPLPQNIPVSWYTQENYKNIDHEEIDLIVNATSVGMNKEERFFLSREFVRGKTVIDWVYPFEGTTQLVQWAQENNQEYIDGKELFIGQAMRQFTRFTNKKVSSIEVKEILDCL